MRLHAHYEEKELVLEAKSLQSLERRQQICPDLRDTGLNSLVVTAFYTIRNHLMKPPKLDIH